MTLLWFLLDVMFYNYTPLKTELILLCFLDKKESKIIRFFSFFLIDFLLLAKGRLLLTYLILYGFNSFFKCSYQNFFGLVKRFFLLSLFYKILIFFFFYKFVFSILGFLITFLFLFIGYKKF